mgnify:FL=1
MHTGGLRKKFAASADVHAASKLPKQQKNLRATTVAPCLVHKKWG